MGLEAEDLEEIAEKILLGQKIFGEVLAFINHKRAQGGKTNDQILAHAEESKKKAEELISKL